MEENDHEFISMVASDFIAEITTCVMLIVIGWLALGDPTKSPSIVGFFVVLGGVSLVVSLVYFLMMRKKKETKAPKGAAEKTTVVQTTKTDDGKNVGTAVGAVGKVGTSEGTKPTVTVVYKDSNDDTDPLASSYRKKGT